jgi:peptidyl-prolyl cis-trans isomerase B (cyclophilin B)
MLVTKVVKIVNMSKNCKFIGLLFLFGLFASSCKSGKTISNANNNTPNPSKLSKPFIEELKQKYPNENLVLISTTYGEMIVRLFNETPLHRDNFVNLVEKKYYDSLLFHRVIKDFMVQGGDPDSKTADFNKILGDGDVGYVVPAEFKKELFHKKGMICAAREGDDINPTKASSGCQFYIVQGKKFTDESLKTVEYRINRPILHQLTKEYLETSGNEAIKAQYERYQKEGMKDSLTALKKKIDIIIMPIYEAKEHYTFTEEQKQVYKTIGGTPHLDGSYTVYGEVILGLDVVDRIAEKETGKNDRPLENVRMKMLMIQKINK